MEKFLCTSHLTDDHSKLQKTFVCAERINQCEHHAVSVDVQTVNCKPRNLKLDSALQNCGLRGDQSCLKMSAFNMHQICPWSSEMSHSVSM
jgi:hypothetical protein